MLDKFLEQLSAVKPLSVEALQHLRSIINIAEKPKGTKLLKESETSNKLYFIIKGLARLYYYEKETEVTSWIVAENGFIFSPTSFILQKPSLETIELLENTTFLIIDKIELEKMYNTYPEMAYISLKMNQKYILIFEERAKILRLSADERYTIFETNYPLLFGRLKMEHLSTYLGLSRSCVQSIKTKHYSFEKSYEFSN